MFWIVFGAVFGTLTLFSFLGLVYIKLVYSEFPPDYRPENYRYEHAIQLDLTTYPNRGLYHSKFPALEDAAEWSQDKHAEYASAVARKYALNRKFLKQYEAAFTDAGKISLLMTTLGDIALIAKHNPRSKFWTELYAEARSGMRKKDN